MRRRGDRRLRDIFVEVERRLASRRELLERRLNEEDRRVDPPKGGHSPNERRKKIRRIKDIEELQKNNPEHTLLIEP
jgi:hypothetical protein